MTNLTEDSIEQWVIELLQKQGYDFVHGPDLMPDAENREDVTRLIDEMKQKRSP